MYWNWRLGTELICSRYWLCWHCGFKATVLGWDWHKNAAGLVGWLASTVIKAGIVWLLPAFICICAWCPLSSRLYFPSAACFFSSQLYYLTEKHSQKEPSSSSEPLISFCNINSVALVISLVAYFCPNSLLLGYLRHNLDVYVRSGFGLSVVLWGEIEMLLTRYKLTFRSTWLNVKDRALNWEIYRWEFTPLRTVSMSSLALLTGFVLS